jgi:hypothetical protein
MPFQKKQSAPQTKSSPKIAAVPTPVPDAPAIEPAADIPIELIAKRAFEKWQRRGSPMGHESEQDWFAAREELEQERLSFAAPTSEDRKVDRTH